MKRKDIEALPIISVQGRRYVDLEALLEYLASLGSPPEPSLKRTRAADADDARKLEGERGE